MKSQHVAAVAVLLLGAQLASAQKVGPVDFAQECPGNLLINGGFEEPNTEQKWTQLPDPTSNSKWGWYEEIPGRQQAGRRRGGRPTHLVQLHYVASSSTLTLMLLPVPL